MKLKFPLIAAFVAVLGLTACGGGGSDTSPPPATNQPAALTKTDTVVGTGAEATVGSTLSAKYSGYLYSATAADFKGTHFQTGTIPSFKLGVGAVIAGWDQGIVGMKVGGKRTLIIPASLAYGSDSHPGIPANSALVFDVELLSVQ